MGYEGYYTNTEADINKGYAKLKSTQSIQIFKPQNKIQIVDKNILKKAPVAKKKKFKTGKKSGDIVNNLSKKCKK